MCLMATDCMICVIIWLMTMYVNLIIYIAPDGMLLMYLILVALMHCIPHLRLSS